MTTMEEATGVQSEVVAPEPAQQEGDGGEVVQQEESIKHPVQREEGVEEGASGGGEVGATVDLPEAQGLLRSTKRNPFGSFTVYNSSYFVALTFPRTQSQRRSTQSQRRMNI